MMNDARKEGTMSWNMGKVDPEIEGYNGKNWDDGRYGGSQMRPELMGSGFGWEPAGGPREETRGTGNVTTQTERGYSVLQQPWNMIDEGADIGVPNQQGTLATGGTLSVATEGMDIEIPKANWAKLGISGLKSGASMFIPFFGIVSNIGGRIYQKVHKDQDPNVQSAMEMMMGYDPRYQGKFFRMGKKTWTPGQQATG